MAYTSAVTLAEAGIQDGQNRTEAAPLRHGRGIWGGWKYYSCFICCKDFCIYRVVWLMRIMVVMDNSMCPVPW